MMALDNNYLLFSQQPLQFDWDPQYSFGLGPGDVSDNAIVPPLGIISNTKNLSLSLSLSIFCLFHIELYLLMLMVNSDSPMSSEASTGYLQDAVAQWSERCKRRRLASSPCDAAMFVTEDIQDLLQVNSEF